MGKTLKPLIDELTKSVGDKKLRAHLESILEEKHAATLTIISNYSLHPLRTVHRRGDVFIASEGSFDFRRPKGIQRQLERVLERVVRKLKSKPWKKVYLVPFGPAVLAMQIKLLVYRTLHIETIDVMHIGEERYVDIDINLRDLRGFTSPKRKEGLQRAASHRRSSSLAITKV